MRVYCLRIGDKYGPEYEDYINKKLKKYEVIWIREPYSRSIPLQWNKMMCMNLDIDEPIVVLDIDVILTGDYEKLFDYPVERGQFLSIPHWWSQRYPEWMMNGGFQKYYPKDCKYIYDIFMENPKYWMMHYIREGLTVGPVNGEQFFVEEHVKQKLQLELIPRSWITRWSNEEPTNEAIQELWYEMNGTHLMMNSEWNDSVKLVHFTTSLNKPHESHLWK